MFHIETNRRKGNYGLKKRRLEVKKPENFIQC